MSLSVIKHDLQFTILKYQDLPFTDNVEPRDVEFGRSRGGPDEGHQ